MATEQFQAGDWVRLKDDRFRFHFPRKVLDTFENKDGLWLHLEGANVPHAANLFEKYNDQSACVNSDQIPSPQADFPGADHIQVEEDIRVGDLVNVKGWNTGPQEVDDVSSDKFIGIKSYGYQPRADVEFLSRPVPDVPSKYESLVTEEQKEEAQRLVTQFNDRGEKSKGGVCGYRYQPPETPEKSLTEKPKWLSEPVCSHEWYVEDCDACGFAESQSQFQVRMPIDQMDAPSALWAAYQDGSNESAQQIANTIFEIGAMLLDKNRKYGDAALDPMRVFSKLDPVEMIKVRMDDKLSRINNGAADEDEDPIFDLIGYLVLYMIARRKADGGRET